MASATRKTTKPGFEEQQEQINRIRITLTSKNVKNLEKGILRITVRIPTKSSAYYYKEVPLWRRKETNTWDRFELRVHKRVIDLYSSPEANYIHHY